MPHFAVPWQVSAFFAVFVAVIFIGISIGRRKKQVFDALGTFLQGSVSGSALLGFFTFRGYYKNRPLKIERRPPGKNTPEWLKVTFEDPPFAFGLKVSKEGFFKSAMKKMGLMKDIETGDAAFDERLYAASETRELAAGYLSDAARRALVISLFDAGAYDLEVVAGGVTIPGLLRLRKRGPDLEKDLSMQNLLPLLDTMDQLCSERNAAEFFVRPGGTAAVK